MARYTRHMSRLLENMRERPHDERVALAAGAAFVVVGVLLVVWVAFFVKRAPMIARDAAALRESASYQVAQQEYDLAQERLQQLSAQAAAGVAPIEEYKTRIEALEATLNVASSTEELAATSTESSSVPLD